MNLSLNQKDSEVNTTCLRWTFPFHQRNRGRPRRTCPTFVKGAELHVHEHHEAPAEAPHQKHGDLHAVDDQVVQHAKVQAPVPQQEQDDRQLVLQPQEHAHADVLQEEEGRERHPEQGGQQAAAEVEEEPQEAVHAAGAQVEVKVVVLGAHQLGGVRRPAGRVHAGGVGAVEAAHPPRDGDQRHGWATARGSRRRAGSSAGAACWEGGGFIWLRGPRGALAGAREGGAQSPLQCPLSKGSLL